MSEVSTPLATALAPDDREVVTLERPITRAGGDITTVAVRRPLPLDCQGLSLRDIVDMEGTAMMTLLPRVTEPNLLPQEVATMHTLDFLALSAEASGFFLPKVARPAFPTQ